MSEIQSNYPRATDFGQRPINVPALQRTAFRGMLAVVGNWILSVATFVAAATSTPNSAVDKFGGYLVLIWLISYFGVGWHTVSWVYRAHFAVCELRQIVPKISQMNLAGLVAIPIVLFGLPLSYAMDFLVLRSEGLDKPTLKWTSLWSKSFQVNVFAALMALPGILIVAAISNRMSYDDKCVLAVFAIISVNFAMLLGMTMVFQVNRRISLLVEARNRLQVSS